MNRPDFQRRNYIAQATADGEFLLTDRDGYVSLALSAEEVVERASGLAKDIVHDGEADGIITEIDWRGVPEGFAPPEVR